MVSKFLEGTRNCIIEQGDVIQLEYYLVETQAADNSEIGQTLYGIEIAKRYQDCHAELEVESDMVPKLSEDKEKVKTILNQLIASSVTPVTLLYVLDDYSYEMPYITS